MTHWRLIEDGFAEANFGEWDGHTFAEIMAKWPDRMNEWLSATNIAPPGGESFDQVRERVDAARQSLLAKHEGKRIVIATHVTPIKLAIRAGLGVGDELLFRLHLDLASVSDVRFYPDGPTSVHLVNDTSHLD